MAEAITLHIEGMTCTSCAEHVQQALTNVPGVRAASVSYPQRQAEIEADAGVSVAPLVAAVATLGYRALLTDTPNKPAGLLDKALGWLGGETKHVGGEQALHVAVIGSGGAAMAADADAADSPATGRKSSKGTGSGSAEGPPGPDGAGGGGAGADAGSPLSSSGGIAQQGLIVLLLTLAASLGLRLGGPRGPVLSWTIYAGGVAAAGPGYTVIRYFEFLLEGGRMSNCWELEDASQSERKRARPREAAA